MFNLFGNRKEQEERVKSAGRLPPGQALTQKFPVLHYGPIPPFNPATWDFRVFGLVEEEKRWTWDEFNRLPRRKMAMDIHCVTRWSKFDTVWEGVSVKTLVENGLIKIKPTATHVMQHAEYGFTVNLPLEVVLQENFLCFIMVLCRCLTLPRGTCAFGAKWKRKNAGHGMNSINCRVPR